MQKTGHHIYISTLASIIVLTTISLFILGFPYYHTTLTERFYHSDHDLYKPSGLIGHGLGIIGTLFIVIGVFSYMARKRYRFLARFGRLKYWLESHIFLCILGPIMILYHTAFKFGGIVSVSFWSMVVVVASGVIGRYIYLQIPRSMEGRELSLNEVREMKSNLNVHIKNRFNLDENSYNAILEYTSINSVHQNGDEKIRAIRMNKENKQTKEELLADIEKLIAYGREEATINPDLLAYLEIDDLISTKKKLLERVGTLSEEDKEWLQQFKKYE